MINDLDDTLARLLTSGLPDRLAAQTRISFAAPDAQFPPQSVTLPAIDLFLYEISENTGMRSNEFQVERRPGARATVTFAPRRYDFSYLITAWPSTTITDPWKDEHRLLGEVMLVLLKHATLPAPGDGTARELPAARPRPAAGPVLAGDGRQAQGGAELHGDPGGRARARGPAAGGRQAHRPRADAREDRSFRRMRAMPDLSRARPRPARTNLLRAASFALLLPGAGHAAALEVLAGRQTAPGDVEVTVRVDAQASAPQPGNWVLRLDGPVDIEASRLRVLPADPPPAWLVLCLDRSGSLSDAAVEEIRQALAASLQRDAQGTMPYQIALISFATDIRQVPRFSNHYPDIEAALGGFAREHDPHGLTRLYDATLAALANLRGRVGGKRLILVSDGKDEGSLQGVERLKRDARADDDAIPIDTVAYGTQSPSFGGSLSELAGITRGRSDAAADPHDLGTTLRHLLNDVSGAPTSYLLSFHYPAVAGRNSAVSEIVYAPAGGAPVAGALAAPVAAATGPGKEAGGAGEGPTYFEWFEHLVKFFGELPPLVKAISGLLAALTAFLAARKTVQIIVEQAPRFRRWLVIHIHHQAPPTSNQETVVPPPPPSSSPVRNATMINVHAWPDPAHDRPAAILRGVEGTARGHTLKVTKPVFTIGAGDDNDLVLVGDEWASAHHARLRVQSGSLYVEDLGSTNGSFHNQTKFRNETKGLAPGDMLRFGHSSFQVLDASRQPA
jgi:hypothetical protein